MLVADPPLKLFMETVAISAIPSFYTVTYCAFSGTHLPGLTHSLKLMHLILESGGVTWDSPADTRTALVAGERQTIGFAQQKMRG